jgi:hypothetical protein
MTPNEYLAKLNERRQKLTGMARVWADYNMELEILQESPSLDIVDMAIADCRLIIADLNKQMPTRDILDALEVKQNELADLQRDRANMKG